LTGGQPEIQGNNCALAGGDFFHHAFEVDKIGTKDLQTLLQFFDLMLNVFFYGGKFWKTITDMNVHERLGLANEVAQPSAF